MRGAPIPPEEYAADRDAEILDDAKLKELGYAHGLGFWEQMGKAYEWYLAEGRGDAPSGLDNAQMWSLRQAIRAELLAELKTGETA